MREKKLYFTSCHLAGREYHEADEVWGYLRIGTILQLERDLENRHDPYAVAVLFKKEYEEEPYLLGYIPRGENKDIANLIDMGWKDIFECRISQINAEAHPEDQVHLTIKVKENRKDERR